MYLLSVLPSKMGRYQLKKLARPLEFPAVQRVFRQAGSWRPAEPRTVRRAPWRPAGRNGVVPRGLLCASAMVLSTFGCEPMSPPGIEDTALVTDGTSFRLEREVAAGHVWYSTRIPYSFTNRTGSKVYLPNCRDGFDLSLQMKEAGEWDHIWSPILLDCLSPPIVIEPGEEYETILTVSGCLSGNCAPRLVLPPDPSTPVRILWGRALSSYDPDGPPWGELIPLEERVSNRFTLQVSN